MGAPSQISVGKLKPFSIVKSSCPEHKHILSISIPRLSHCHIPLILSQSIVSGLLLKLPLVHSVLRTLSLGPFPSLSLSFLSLLRHSGYMTLDNYSLNIAFSATARLPSVSVGAQLHSLSVELGLVSDTFVLNSLINMYSSCSYPTTARQVLACSPARLLPKELVTQFLGTQ